jgi:hypothetical protein
MRGLRVSEPEYEHQQRPPDGAIDDANMRAKALSGLTAGDPRSFSLKDP